MVKAITSPSILRKVIKEHKVLKRMNKNFADIHEKNFLNWCSVCLESGGW